MTPAIEVVRILPAEMPAHRAAWHDLVGRCIEPNVFNEPDFLLAATAYLGPPKDLCFLAVRSTGRSKLLGLCAVVPGGRLGASAWTYPQATAAFPLLDREAAAAAFAALMAAVGTLPGHPAAFRLDGVPCGGPTARVLRAQHPDLRCLEMRTRAVLLSGLRAPGRSGKARKEARRQWNRLSERGALVFESVHSAAGLAAALDRFLALEERSWKGRRGTALRDGGGREAFARALIAGLAASGQCRIDRLTLDGRTIAAGIVLRSGDRGYYWKTAYDETLARFSPGVQLTLRLTELQHAESGLAVTDSCAIPGHSMIDRVWPDRIDVADYIVPTPQTSAVWFAAAHAAETGRRRVRDGLKRAYRALVRA